MYAFAGSDGLEDACPFRTVTPYLRGKPKWREYPCTSVYDQIKLAYFTACLLYARGSVSTSEPRPSGSDGGSFCSWY